MTGNLTFRHVRADDARQLALLHQEAFPDFFLSSLGTAFLRQFYLGFADDRTAISVVAETPDGRIVGSVVGTTEPAGFFSRLLRQRVLQFAAVSARESIRRPRTVPRLLRAVRYRGDTGDSGDSGDSGDGALLSSICVRRSQQGQGTGRAMLREWARYASTAGAECAYLTTDAEANDAVNKFYRNLGWNLESTYSTPEGRRMNRYSRLLPREKENQT